MYFFLGESLMKVGRAAEALPYFERLVAEFEQSEHLQEARARIAQLKTTAANTGKAPDSRVISRTSTRAASRSQYSAASSRLCSTSLTRDRDDRADRRRRGD